jgi:hypothetical protein
MGESSTIDDSFVRPVASPTLRRCADGIEGHLAVVLLALVLTQGILGFAVVGAAVGPVIAAASLGTMLGDLGPFWVAVATTGTALLLALPLLPVITPRNAEAVKRLTPTPR